MKRPATLRFRLFIAGETQNSVRAIANLSALCQAYLTGRHEIEVIDVFKEPKRALEDRILMTPTLLKLAPGQKQRIIGTLSDTPTVLAALALEMHVLDLRAELETR